MRKSERIRLLELQVLELQKDVQVLLSIVDGIIENKFRTPDLESGKWYKPE